MTDISSDLFNNIDLCFDSQMIGGAFNQAHYNDSWEDFFNDNFNVKNKLIFENNQSSMDSTAFISNQQNTNPKKDSNESKYPLLETNPETNKSINLTCQQQSYLNAIPIVEGAMKFEPDQIDCPIERKKHKRNRKLKKEKTNENQVEIEDEKERKEMPDGIRKKIKVDFLKFLKEILDKYYNKHFPNENLKFNKLNQKTIMIINIEFNSEFLEKSLYQVYLEDRNTSRGDIDQFKNSKLIQRLYEIEELKPLLDAPLKSLFTNSYLNSNNYNKKIDSLRKKENESYVEKFQELSENFVCYFLETKKNERKSPHNKKQEKNKKEANSELN